jgi:hypothetical protein
MAKESVFYVDITTDDPLAITPETLHAIHAICTSNQNGSDDITDNEITLLMHTIQSESITDAKRALGHLTHHKLRTLATWPQ